MSKPIDNYMTVAEASYRWGISIENVKQRLKPSVVGNENLESLIEEGIVKSFKKPEGKRKEWIVSKEFMENFFGKPKKIDKKG